MSKDGSIDVVSYMNQNGVTIWEEDIAYSGTEAYDDYLEEVEKERHPKYAIHRLVVKHDRRYRDNLRPKYYASSTDINWYGGNGNKGK